MATQIILDSSVFIDYLRKTNKSKACLHWLAHEYRLTVSVITRFEIEIGLNSERQWQEYQEVMQTVQVLPVDQSCIEQAIRVDTYLKSCNQRIELADLLIGSTALAYRFSIATLNTKHFERIPYLQLVDVSR